MLTSDRPISTRHDRFADFYRTHRESVARALAVAVRSSDLAARSTDEAMIEAAASWRTLRTDPSQPARVFRRALEIAAQESDPLSSDESQSPESQSPESQSRKRQTRRDIQNRALVVLQYLLGWPIDDLAKATGFSPTTVRKQLTKLRTVNSSEEKDARVRRAMSQKATSYRPPPGDLAAVEREAKSRRIRRLAVRYGSVFGTALAILLITMVVTANRPRVSEPSLVDAQTVWERQAITIRQVPTENITAWGTRTRRGLSVIVDQSRRGILGNLGRFFGRNDDLTIITSEDGQTWERRGVRDGKLRGVQIADVAEAAGVVTLLGTDLGVESGAEVILRSGDLDRWDRIDLIIPREGTPLPSGLVWAYDTSLIPAGEEVAVSVEAFATRDFGTDDNVVIEASADVSVGPPPVQRFYTYDDGEWTELERSGIPDWNDVADLWRRDERWYAAGLDGSGSATIYAQAQTGFEEVVELPADAVRWTERGLSVYAAGNISIYGFDGIQLAGFGLPLTGTPEIIPSGDALILITLDEVAAFEGDRFWIEEVGTLRPQDSNVRPGTEINVLPVAVLGDTLLARPSDSLSTWWSISRGGEVDSSSDN